MPEIYTIAAVLAVLIGIGSTVIMVWGESTKPAIRSHSHHDTRTGSRL